MAIQRPVAGDDRFNAHPIDHQLRRDVTPEECYQCESANQYVRQMQRNERLCAGDAFYDLYSICVGCIEDSIESGSPRDYVEPNLGRYVDYCAQFTSLTKWASMGAMSTTSATLQSTTATSAEKTDDTITDEARVSVITVGQPEKSIAASTTNTIPQTTTEVAQPEDSAGSPNVPEKDSSGSSKAWIAGAVVPSALFLAAAIAFAIWWQKRRKRRQDTSRNPPVDDVAGASRFDKPELDSQGISRPRSKEEGMTSTSTVLHDTVAAPRPAEMPEDGLNRAELQGVATGSTGQNHGSETYYELPADQAAVYELPTKLR
ncbi:hypothetical protein FPHYL_13552 [Fusarium phyllophilum]|uniref:Uncharacterized protein n=1 Tax=Fusarium phyllophilum TaxID=47803 RepID=A0A8H5IG68_9HYPO|nr:hypothetical protein FPHYL_13552 [Fusarium phyllophilum]